MKKIDIFGFQISFGLEKKNWDDPEIYSSETIFREKIFYFIIIACFFVLSKQVSNFLGSENYKAGDVAKMNLYAPKSSVYRDEKARENIIESLMLTAGKEYLFVANAEKYYLDRFESFFQKIEIAKEKKISFNNQAFEKESGIKIPLQLSADFTNFSKKNIEKKREKIKKVLEEAYKEGIFQENQKIEFSEPLKLEIEKLEIEELELIKLFIVPNYIYDVEKTKSTLKQKVDQIGEQLVEIKGGQLIAEKGELLTESKIKLMEAAGIYSFKKNIFMLILNIIYLTIVSTLFFMLSKITLKKEILNKNIYRSSILIIGAMFAMYRFIGSQHIFLIPFDAVLFLLLILTNGNYAFILLIFQLGLILPMIDFNSKFFIINLLTILYSMYLIKKIRTRSEVLNIGIKIAIIKVMLFILLAIFAKDDPSILVLKSSEILVSGVLSGMLTLAFVPYFERTFNLLNIFRLLELGDLSNPILKRLSMEAPGTFQHSIMVATLSENAAENIGADSVFTRVAAYYHDIGKLKRPKFFVENQSNEKNPHDDISPSMSNLIIKSHTKDGVELGKKYKIPKEIRDIMIEHQGTTLLAYFYNKARKIDPSIKKDDFKYSGPKPRTKESAIIMLADSIEAAVRSIEEKTQISIEVMVRKIINSKIEDSQLSDADLTFREIEQIKSSFVNTLVSMHHARMKYPGQK
ncbi:MAG: HD family phosphohydrolase [Fusobacteriaceae bacterium]